MLAKNDEIIADDDLRVSFKVEHVATDDKTGKPVLSDDFLNGRAEKDLNGDTFCRGSRLSIYSSNRRRM